MLILEITQKEVDGLLEASLEDWSTCYGALLSRMVEATHRGAHPTVIGVYEDDFLCLLTSEHHASKSGPGGFTIYDLQLLEERLDLKQCRYNRLSGDFGEECYWGEGR